MAQIYDNPESYDNGEMNFKEKVEHIWYHYKWVIIIGGIIAVFLLVGLVQFFGNKDPDVNVMHVGPMYLSPSATDKATGFSTNKYFTFSIAAKAYSACK